MIIWIPYLDPIYVYILPHVTFGVRKWRFSKLKSVKDHSPVASSQWTRWHHLLSFPWLQSVSKRVLWRKRDRGETRIQQCNVIKIRKKSCLYESPRGRRSWSRHFSSPMAAVNKWVFICVVLILGSINCMLGTQCVHMCVKKMFSDGINIIHDTWHFIFKVCVCLIEWVKTKTNIDA